MSETTPQGAPHGGAQTLAILWPEIGNARLAAIDEPVHAGEGEVLVQTLLSITNTGTERARFTGAPNAIIGFPHVPGFGSVGRALTAAPGIELGTPVAVRAGTHQSTTVAPADRVRVIPPGVEALDAALWQVGLIASHGLDMGGYLAGEPVTVVGTGLIGTMARRLATALGTRECRVLAGSRAKEWTIHGDPASCHAEFVLADMATSPDKRHRLVLDATGTASGLAVAVAAAADGGRIVLLGSPRVPSATVPIGELHERGLTLIGAHIDTLPDAAAAAGRDLATHYTDRYFMLLADSAFSMADLATGFRPEQAAELYRRMVEDRGLVLAAVEWEAGGETVAGPSPQVAVRELTRPLGMAVVGCGDIGAQNADAVVQAPGTKLVSCCDLDAELARGLADRLGAASTTSLEDLLVDPGVDAVLVATPHDTHEQLALRVLAAGKHLLLQKPLSADLASARRIAAAATAAEPVASVLMPGRYEPGYLLARRALTAGWLGVPLGLVSTYLVDKPATYYRGGYSRRAESTWRLSKKRSGGGVLIMNLLHHLDIARSLLGAEADSVYARTLPSEHSPEIEDVASLVTQFGDTVATFVGAASVPGRPGEQLRVWGASGNCVVLPEGRLTGTADRLEDRGDVGGALRDPQAAAVQGFAEAVLYGRQPDVTVEDALAVQALVEAAYLSAETGAPVRPADLFK